MTSDDVVRIIMAVGCLILAVMLFYGVLFSTIPKENKDVIQIILAFAGGTLMSPVMQSVWPKRKPPG